jgi:hypothetical protein
MNILNFSLVLLSLSLNLVTSTDTQCPTAPSVPSDRRSNKNNFRLVQYNVEWLFTDYYSNAQCPGSGCAWTNQSEAQTHMDWVSQVITDLNPDYVNLCEVEGCDELNELVDKLDGSYEPYLIKGTDSSTGQNVGIITRVDPVVNLYRDESRYSYPIPGSKCGYTGPSGTSGVSKHYITELNLSGLNIAVIGLHFLAIPTDPTRCAEREAQALVVQQIASKYLNLGYEVIMLGDMNDYDGQVLDVNKSIPMIDHILVTPGLTNKIINVFVYHGYEEYCLTYNSDHYPIVIDFEL